MTMNDVRTTEVSELAGHLKAELLSVRLGLQLGELTPQGARRRMLAIRRRRVLAAEELRGRLPEVVQQQAA
jgi:hypothetical protein